MERQGAASIRAVRLRGVLVAVIALILLAAGVIVASLASVANRYWAYSADRERTQVVNALDLRLKRMRNDLTSITFWDEAVENTALRYDPAWVDQNIGRWLH
ncbi:MAG: hypothetical protein INF91_05920, partial [Alphaproteobacteria bacterium]|nr:hypothetical protein [Alphaproteobacteria bacterium]